MHLMANTWLHNGRKLQIQLSKVIAIYNFELSNRLCSDLGIRSRNLDRIKSVFQCSGEEASSLILKCKSLRTKNVDPTLKLVGRLKDLGVQPESLVQNIDVLEIPQKDLKERLGLLVKLGYTDLNSSLRLLHSTTEAIKSYYEITKTCGAKAVEFAKLMDCSVVDACQHFKKHRFLRLSKMSTLKAKIDLVSEEGGVPKDELSRDLWVLSYTLGKLEQRLCELKKMEIAPLKPWMFRCNQNIIERTWSNREENRAAMAPYSSPEDYLCHRLALSPEQIKLFAAKHPPVMRVQVSKLKEMMDFLFSEGITQVQIYHTPRILCHSFNTIQSRLNALRERKYEPHSLSIICRSRRTFEEFLKKLSPRPILD